MKNKSQKLIGALILLAFTVAGVFLGYSLVEHFGDSLSWLAVLSKLLVAFVLIFIAFLVHVVMHEAGHMVAALIRRWKFVSFMILGWVLTRRDGHFHLSRFSIPGAGGQCLMSPPEDGDTDNGIAFYNAGGFIMNTIIVLLSAVCIALSDGLLWEVIIFLYSLVFIGIILVLLNAVPLVAGGLPNDGKNILNLRKDRFSTHVFLTTMRAMGKMQQGEPVDNVMHGYICDGRKIDYANPIHQMALSFDISYALSKSDFDKAHSIFDDIYAHWNQIVQIYQKELMFDKVYLYLVSPREGTDVRKFMDKGTLKYMEMQCVFRPTALRTKYAYTRLYKHDEAEAENIYHEFLKVCDKYHIKGEVVVEKRLVEYVRNMDITK